MFYNIPLVTIVLFFIIVGEVFINGEVYSIVGEVLIVGRVFIVVGEVLIFIGEVIE